MRPFRFAANYFQRIKDSIERKRTAMIPGDGSVRHSFICVDNVAAFLTASVPGGSPGIPPGFYDIGGPDALSFLDVVHLYEGVLGFGLRVKRTPAWVFRIAETILKPFSPAGSNLMFFNYVAATEHSVMDMAKTAALFQVQLTSAESFLRNKHSMAIAAAA